MLNENRLYAEKQGIDKYHDAGFKGAGVRIGMLDTGFVIPDGWLGGKIKYGGEPETFNGQQWEHGAMTAHVLHQVAPEATIYTFNANRLMPYDVIELCIKQNIDILTASLGYPDPGSWFMRELAKWSEKFLNKGGLLCAAAGNSDYDGVSVPAKKDTWLAVGAAVLDSGAIVRKYYSAVGSALEVMGFTNWRINIKPVGDTIVDIYTGTSAACPNVAGLLALYITARGKPRSKEQIRAMIEANTLPVVQAHSRDKYTGFGLLVLPALDELGDYDNGGNGNGAPGFWEQLFLFMRKLVKKLFSR